MSTPTIHPRCLPVRNPFNFLSICGLLLDKCDAPGWAWGAFGTIAALLVAAFFTIHAKEKWRDVPGFGKDTQP